ncbi:hypothetical protein DYB28_006209 [Aphanomyces astaci]|uniref:Sulfatase-modifying factor enzyme-like domain-containing protein n=1 Tax=Aphanomyces astaci TaxID=112090 RepID=A0A9X8E0Y9_APHAT|nr:hypothetical protein DYB28_006209 [Aphanomyces astaci]
MPDGYELLDGPALRDRASIDAWRAEWGTWKRKELQSVRYDPDGVCNVYNLPSLQWTQRSFVQVFAMLHDRTLYDRPSNAYTVDKFVTSFDLPIDSVLLWPSYPNLGIDARNQFDFWSILPGGLDGLRSLVDDFHAHNVTVFLPYQPWDTATRNSDPTLPRYRSDIATLHTIVDAIGADGINGDTMYGVPASFFNCSAPTATCPEGGLPSHTLGVNPMSWGYYFGFSQFPPVARAKYLEPRHTPLVCARWSLSRSVELQMAFFNGAGYVVWENIWGIWNAMTEREWQELKRTSAILRRFPEAMHSTTWQPYVPDLPANVHGSAFPTPHHPSIVFTFIHTSPDDFTGVVTLDLPGLTHDVAVFDLYHGLELNATVDATHSGDGSTVSVPVAIEGYGYGALLVVHRSEVGGLDDWLPGFLSYMHQLTALPLRAYGTARPLLSQSITSLKPVTTIVRAQKIEASPKAAASALSDLDLVSIPGSEAWKFVVNGVQIEPVQAWTPHGDDLYGVGVQFPWESRPSPHHATELWVDPFHIMRHPVTNGQYQSFLLQSNYTPSDLSQFLQTWHHRYATEPTTYQPVTSWTYPPGAADHPVVHVSVEDARAFADFYGLRLPHDWEWQYVASNGPTNQSTLHPWGDSADLTRVPSILRGEVDSLVGVGGFPDGCTTAGVCDLEGLVWEMTDTFCDTHTCSLLLRGGSRYQPVASSLNDPNWYFPHVKHVQEHGKWLQLSPSYDRSATVGFRCVQDSSSVYD